MPKSSIDLHGVFGALQVFYRRHGHSPSYGEIQRLFRYRSKNAAHWLVKRLEKARFLERDSAGRILPGSFERRRVLGSVAAGFPSPAEEELLDTLSLDRYLISNPEKTFLVKVTGDSMVDAGIREGDLVLVERGRQPRLHDIVVAQVDGEWTMKFYEKNKTGVMLMPANPKYKAIVPRRELIVGGVVVAAIRKYR